MRPLHIFAGFPTIRGSTRLKSNRFKLPSWVSLDAWTNTETSQIDLYDAQTSEPRPLDDADLQKLLNAGVVTTEMPVFPASPMIATRSRGRKWARRKRISTRRSRRRSTRLFRDCLGPDPRVASKPVRALLHLRRISRLLEGEGRGRTRCSGLSPRKFQARGP